MQLEVTAFRHWGRGMTDRAMHPTHVPSPALHFHGLTIGTTKALAQLPPGTALCSSFPQPENSSIKLSRNLLRTPKGTVMCVCSGQR